MTVEERIHRILILEEIKKNKEMSEKLGLKDISSFIKEKKNNDRNHS